MYEVIGEQGTFEKSSTKAKPSATTRHEMSILVAEINEHGVACFEAVVERT